MNFFDDLLFRCEVFYSVLLYVAIICGIGLCYGVFLQLTVIQPEIDNLLKTIPIMDCKELGEKILNGEINYYEPKILAEKHWQIRCHGGLK